MKAIKVMMVGSAPKSNGGVTTVIRTIKESYIWNKYQCYWLGTQIQANKWIKLYYCLKAYIIAFFTIKKYDIIHFHAVPDISLVVQFPVYALAMLWRKKIILHMHVGNQLVDYKNSKLFHFCIKHSHLILVLSPKWKILFNEQFAKFKKQVEVLYNACDKTSSLNYEQRTNTIVFAGHLDRNKAYDVLLKGFSSISDKITGWKLIIMGAGELEEAKALAKKLNIESNIEFKGYITGKEKEKYFQEAALFCLCSYQEGFPMAVMEAWAYGIPVITTPAGGLPDVIIEGENAITFNFGDYKMLGDKIYELINDYPKRLHMSNFSKKFVENNFAIKPIANKLDLYYSSLFNN